MVFNSIWLRKNYGACLNCIELCRVVAFKTLKCSILSEIVCVVTDFHIAINILVVALKLFSNDKRKFQTFERNW